MAENRSQQKQNKGKNGGQGGGASASAHKTIEYDTEQQVFPPYPAFIPPYPGPQPTYFPAPGGARPMFQPYNPPQSDNGLMEIVQEMNNRLKTIEINVAKIVPLEKDVTYLKNQVSALHNTNKTLSDRITELESFCQTYSDITDDYLTTKRKLQDEITNVKGNLETQVKSLHSVNNSLSQKCIDTQTRYMENQLLIFGVDEARQQGLNNEQPSRENTEQVLRDVLKEQLQDNSVVNSECQINIDDIKFDKVTRLGNPNRRAANNRPRPIMARFERFAVREKVRRAGTILNKSQRQYKIYEHFPREVEERRKALYPIARQYSERQHKVNLVRDRLYIDNVLYDPDRRMPIGRDQRGPPNSGDFYSSHNTRSFQRPIQPPGYYSETTQHQVRHVATNSFETPNRFAVLSDNTPKRKARSPLDLETAPKRVDSARSPQLIEEIDSTNTDSTPEPAPLLSEVSHSH